MEVRQFVNGLIKAQQTRRQCLRLMSVASPSRSMAALSKRTLTTSTSAEAAAAAATSAPHSKFGNQHFAPPNANNAQTPSTENASKPGQLNEVDQILRAISANPIPKTSPAPSPRQSPPSDGLWGQDIKNMLNMYDKRLPSRSETKKSLSSAVELRLSPSLGRTVAVDHVRNFDVGKALSLMESRCAANKVRVHEREQRFYVRRGQLRKEVRMKRWRKLFKFSFQQTVARCEKLRKQGW
ncbi:hypothetical protein D8B26_004184 [Coccidioides posadasii str. Silveira]|uniref:Uncharacterized protein n=1 Tax=Coccidioides posadasii (strain RMSCC 757 / Silveira) TaxID=443226 RepID=E9DJ88_COCPS|nr:conserved hypothetical protein [Coccidioides posadasii str. Silveira]QVM09526.1 hypothetical protein D8B26_004184 [Coccidioides posadasii str. Silveira]